MSDPWSELAQPAAARRFRVRVLKIVSQLRSELSREIRLAEKLIEEKGKVGFMNLPVNHRISPLGYYIAAQRTGMPELADRFAIPAAEQHRSCPLYRLASLPFVSSDLYPSGQLSVDAIPDNELRTPKKLIVMN
ncbi:MAG: hypothetical protein ACLQGP_25275 [Isosphaeraceae bacterium]